MDIDLDFVDPEKEMGLDENAEEEGVNQPDSGEKLNKCNQCDYASSQAGKVAKYYQQGVVKKTTWLRASSQSIDSNLPGMFD